MAKMEMAQLFYPDHIEKLKVELSKDGRRPLDIEHYDLLKNEAIKNYHYKKPNSIKSDMEEFYYLIYFLNDVGVPILLEVNTETPKTHILYIKENINSLELPQVDFLLSKKNSWKRFQRNNNNFIIVSFDNYNEIMNGNYIVHTVDELTTKLYKKKYSSVFDMKYLQQNNKTR